MEDENDDMSSIALLKKTLDFTANGIVPSIEDREEMAGQLMHLQERYDLAQVGLGNFHMRRVADLAAKMVGLENDFFGEDGKMNPDIPIDIRIKVYQEIAKQLHLSSQFVDNQATSPTVSSPERMERVTNDPEVDDEMVKTLAPASRRKVQSLLKKLQALPTLPDKTESVPAG